MLLLRLLGNGC